MVWATSESVLSDGREPLHASTRPLPFFWKGVIGPLCRHSHPLCLLPLRPAALWMDAEQHGSQAPEGGAQGQCHGSGALEWAGWHFTAPSREWDRQGHCLYGRAFQAASVNGVIGPAMAAAALPSEGQSRGDPRGIPAGLAAWPSWVWSREARKVREGGTDGWAGGKEESPRARPPWGGRRERSPGQAGRTR